MTTELTPCPNCGEPSNNGRTCRLCESEDAMNKAFTQRPAAQTEREADGLPLIVAGAIFDFAGFMTTRAEVIEVGSTAEAGPVADLVKEWAELRGLDLADAAVLSWQLRITRASLPAHQQATPEPVGEALGYIPTDAIDQIKTPPRLITRNVPVLSYAADGYTAIYTRPAPGVPEDVQRNAARWEEVLRQVGADRQCGGFRFTLHNLRPIPGSNPMQGAVCQHFTQAVDAALAAAQAKNSPTKDQPTAEKGNHD